MLGRVRPSPSSLECLELQRPATKIIKDDSLSIYEATLAKLREGSRRALVTLSEQAHGTDESSISASNSSSEEDMAVEISCSSSILSSSTSQHPLGTSEKPRKRNVSIVYLFSRYKNSRRALRSGDDIE